MKKRSVLILIDDFGQGGAQRQVALLARELVTRGQNVVVARYADDDFLESEIAASKAEIVRLDGNRGWRWVLSLARLVAARRPAVLCAFLIGPASLALLARRVTRVRFPIVVCERGTDQNERPGIKRSLGLALYRHADAIVCNSRCQEQWLTNIRPNLRQHTTYIGNAVDIQKFAFSVHLSGHIRSLVVLSRVVESKGVAVLAAALRLFHQHQPQSELQVRWFGQNYEDGPVLCRQAGESSDDIAFSPPVSDVVETLAGADALLLPSVYGEGTPNVVLEAMAVGRPVIATDVGDVGCQVIDNVTGWRVPAGDPQALAQALGAAIAASPDEVRAMSVAGRSHVVNTATIESIVDDYESTFARLG